MKMHEWITDSHRLAAKTTVRFFVAFILGVSLGGCAVSPVGQRKADAAVLGVNYTNDYIDFTLMSESGENLGIGGEGKPFSEGGTGGTVCCVRLPGVGQTVRMQLRVGGFNGAADQYKTYTRDAVVQGTASTDASHHSYLIVRFFRAHEVEAELISSGDFEPNNPRVDKLLSGQRVMRQMGE